MTKRLDQLLTICDLPVPFAYKRGLLKVLDILFNKDMEAGK